MVNNSRIEELIRENRAEEIPEAIADGAFFDMQTLSSALIDLVLAGSRRARDRRERRAEPARLPDHARARREGARRRGRRRAAGRASRRRRRRSARPSSPQLPRLRVAGARRRVTTGPT